MLHNDQAMKLKNVARIKLSRCKPANITAMKICPNQANHARDQTIYCI